MFCCAPAIYAPTANPHVWTPADLFVNGETGGWWDFTDATKVFSDTAMTTPASLNGQIQAVADKSGNARHMTTASTTILRKNSGGLDYGDFPGAVVGFSTAAGQVGQPLVSGAGVGGHFAIVGFRPATLSGQQALVDADLSTFSFDRISQTIQSFGTTLFSLAWDTSAPGPAQTSDNVSTSGAFTAGVDATASMWRSNSQLANRANGGTATTKVETTDAAGEGAVKIGIGSSWAGTGAQTSFYYVGRVYEVLFLNRQVTTAELALVESWFAANAH